MVRIIVYIPESSCEIVKQAMFNAGAGRYNDYEHCAWQTLGQGQFKPLEGSQPYIGSINKTEYVSEYKVEMIAEESYLKDIVHAVKKAHPYEEPAMQIIPCINPDSYL
ncbi:MAG: NGG1p interacting factor NIF3 [uncultured Thiotrichaceae bacterium]|uniref:NGG1p interacting factor NIF3 n=1 Tax=uncultured Thiotrichaceae bacterium TaxID=298394 RepID=A0A6S6TKK0_9GAMM|nr:MAG: NGG1p interacting factor NIF3 [uncultured Thiotrichaceae bacterium]